MLSRRRRVSPCLVFWTVPAFMLVGKNTETHVGDDDVNFYRIMVTGRSLLLPFRIDYCCIADQAKGRRTLFSFTKSERMCPLSQHSSQCVFGTLQRISRITFFSVPVASRMMPNAGVLCRTTAKEQSHSLPHSFSHPRCRKINRRYFICDRC